MEEPSFIFKEVDALGKLVEDLNYLKSYYDVKQLLLIAVM
jgi:hypothetical protein